MKSAEKHFLICLLSWTGFLNKKSVFLSRVVLFLRILKVLVSDFCKDRLDNKYSNFVNVENVGIRLFEVTPFEVKRDSKIKKNSKKKRLKKNKKNKKNKKRSLKLIRNDLNRVSKKVVKFDLISKTDGFVATEKWLDKFQSIYLNQCRLENMIENRVLTRSVRRKRGLDKAYVRRLNKRRLSRGEDVLEYKEDSINHRIGINWDGFDAAMSLPSDDDYSSDY